MNLGDTFIWSPDGRIEHLYIAITDPKANDGNFVVFNLTRSTGGPKALTLRIGEHPRIKKYDSDVNFGDGLIVSITKLKCEIQNLRASPCEPMAADVVKRIADFAKGHPAVSADIERMIKNQWQEKSRPPMKKQVKS
jgi:hypothetical protein